MIVKNTDGPGRNGAAIGLAAALALALALTGCGGGGGDSTDGAARPLSVNASAPYAFEGDAPVSLSAGPIASGAAVTWTVSPALGQLSATSGYRVTWTPPARDALAADTTVTVTATSGAGSAVVTLALHRQAMTVPLAALAASAVAGTSPELPVGAVPVVAQSGTLRARVEDPDGAFQSPVEISVGADGGWTLRLRPADTLPAGRHSGSAALTLCADTTCAATRGRALTLPYTLDITENAGLLPLLPFPSAPEWAVFQGNNAHTGHLPVTVNPVRIAKRWEWIAPSVGGQPTPIWATPVSARGVMVLAAGDRMHALAEHDGSRVWSVDGSDPTSTTNGENMSQPAIANDRVHAVVAEAGGARLRVWSAAAGQALWSAPVGASSGPYINRYLSPVLIGTDVFTAGAAPGGTNALYGFDRDGAQRFATVTEAADNWSPAADEALYAFTGPSGDQTLRRIDRQSGATLQTLRSTGSALGGYVMGTAPVLTTTGGVVTVTRDEALSRFDTAANQLSWRIEGRFAGNPALVKGVLLIARFEPRQLEARDERSGALLWSWTPPDADESFVGAVVATDNLAFVSTDRRVVAIDLATHQPVWSHPRAGRLSLSANGLLVLATARRDGLYGRVDPLSDGGLIVFNIH